MQYLIEFSLVSYILISNINKIIIYIKTPKKRIFLRETMLALKFIEQVLL